MAGPDQLLQQSGPGPGSTPPRLAGFTLVELIVIMVLVGILATFAVVRYFDRSEFDETAFADQARSLLRYAQKTAIAQNRPVFVRFAGDSISLCFNTTNPCDAAQRVQSPYTISAQGSCDSQNWFCLRPPANVAYSVSLGSLPRVLSFDALGRPFEGANPVQLAVNVSGGGSAATSFTVEQETGYVH